MYSLLMIVSSFISLVLKILITFNEVSGIIGYNKIVTFLLAILLALGGWNLSQTFKLSNDMVLVKEKISNIEDKVSKFKPNKRNKKKKKN